MFFRIWSGYVWGFRKEFWGLVYRGFMVFVFIFFGVFVFFEDVWFFWVYSGVYIVGFVFLRSKSFSC